MSKINYIRSANVFILKKTFQWQTTAWRGLLSEAYVCEDIWKKRLESPLLKDLKMNQYFVETDKKFGTKRSVSGVDMDLFANGVELESQLDELEHLLYRFRRTKRSIEMMDSTTYAVIRVFLKFKEYESLFRILGDRESYGVFPDFYSYNILMDTFLKEKLYSEAARIAVLMMLQEDFSNKISQSLALYSCQLFLSECSVDSLLPKSEAAEEVVETNNDDDEDVQLVRVPFLRNPFYDDHFNITNPRHLIGKTLYLIGREMKCSVGRSHQLVGLAMFEKWDKVLNLLKFFLESGSDLLSETFDKVKAEIDVIPDDENKTKENVSSSFSEFVDKMKSKGKIVEGELLASAEEHLNQALKLQGIDIEAQKQLFSDWESQRQAALAVQNRELEKERRLKVIAEKKEYLYWKEKLLFFFENEAEILNESKEVEELIQSMKSKVSIEDTYVPPEAKKIRQVKPTIYTKLARVKAI